MIPVAEPKTAEEAISLYMQARARQNARWTPVIIQPAPEPVIETAEVQEDEPEPVRIQRPPRLVPRRKYPRDGLIFEVVTEQFGVTKAEILSSSHRPIFVRPRHIAIWLFSVMTEHSTSQIGLRVGGRDHTSVMHAVKKIDALRTKCDETRRICDGLFLEITERFAAEEA